MPTDQNKMDLVIANAKLRGKRDERYGIGIKDGTIQIIETGNAPDANEVIDAGGNLVTEPFANVQMHLCKAWSLAKMGDSAIKAYQGEGMGKAMLGIELAREVKNKLTLESMTEDARRAVALAAYYGNLHIRALADVDSINGLNGVKALLTVREEFKDIVEIQVTAFPQDGIVKDPGTEELILKCMELGADVVGGIPWIELTDDDAKKHIEVCFDIAQKYDADVSMLLDDAKDGTLRTLEWMALEAIKRGWHGRALGHHCRAMSEYPLPYLYRLAEILKRAGVPIASNPHTGPLHAPVQTLIERGVVVSLPQDDITDAYYPLGRNNMMEVAFLAAHILWMLSRDELASMFDLITTNAALSMNVKSYGLEVGNNANLLVHDWASELDILRYHEAPPYVISNGIVVDSGRMRAIARKEDL
ncbi:MAG: amidohydrolase family protein [Rhodobacter sp.]|nr:amidohydrolase family protein [Rhodobacter sp.]MCY4243051.1 amidohydrolase family protein [Rhodobacter sp.]